MNDTQGRNATRKGLFVLGVCVTAAVLAGCGDGALLDWQHDSAGPGRDIQMPDFPIRLTDLIALSEGRSVSPTQPGGWAAGRASVQLAAQPNR